MRPRRQLIRLLSRSPLDPCRELRGITPNALRTYLKNSAACQSRRGAAHHSEVLTSPACRAAITQYTFEYDASGAGVRHFGEVQVSNEMSELR
jgi:hypothetical protein